MSINNGSGPTGALKANYRSGLRLCYDDGLARLSTATSANGPLPVIGFTAVNVFQRQRWRLRHQLQVLPLKW
ncbi:hypothetical protein [Zoogloea sp.]|uniref:hypothetical protein n=1 Tax=Zoogloea sp. TaxID=49181 RepID=UPI0025EB8E42|nr:hypothetical protein [Zoogloea sp.]